MSSPTVHVWLAQDPETGRIAAQAREWSDGDFPRGLRGQGWPRRETDINASQNNVSAGGGGSAPPPKQQYYVELAPSTWATYNGSGGQRSDTTDVVQGWDPSGFNGDGSGWWVFSLPAITGSVDRVDWYVYCNHTYYNSGGRALWTPIHGGPPNWPISSLALKGAWDPGFNYPKPGGVTVTVPSDWWPLFKVGGGGIGIAADPSGGSNETYYCRFNGPDARLRIWYTQ